MARAQPSEMGRLLAGQIALVTGAAKENGIGFAAARRLAEEGAKIAITDLAEPSGRERLAERAATLEQAGLEVCALTIDVTREEEVTSAVAQVCEHFGGIDILFNNAGYAGGIGAFATLDAARWQRSFDVNVMGIVNMTRAVLPTMRARGGGVIVNNASIAGLGAVSLMAAYTASKFAVVGLTKALACEFAPFNVRVNAVCPGLVWTDIGAIEVEALRAADVDFDTARRALARDVPLGQRWGQPSEIADSVVFLASPRASYLTGVALPVAGGLSAGL